MPDKEDEIKFAKILAGILKENLEVTRQNTDEIRDSVDEARNLADTYKISSEQQKSINKNSRDLAKINSNLVAFEEKRLGNLRNSKDIGRDIIKNESITLKLLTEHQSITSQIAEIEKKGWYVKGSEGHKALGVLDDIQKGLESQLHSSQEIQNSLKKEAQFAKNIENSFGLSGGALKVLNNLLKGALGDTQTILDNTQNRLALLQKENKLQSGLAGKMQGFGIIVGEVGKSIGKNLNDPLTYLAAGLSWDTSVVKLQKSLAISRTDAAILRDDITDVAANSYDAAINAERVQKAYMNLNQAFGVASSDLLKNHGEVVLQSSILQEKWGLSAESAASLAKAAIVAGKPLEQIKLDIIGAVTAAEAQYGAHLNIKEVTEAVGKVTGQVRAQLAGNPVLIAEAVAVAKELGFELDQIAKSASSFLNFESSINAELEAELLTGKQLNLEIARSAALTGDYKTVAEEVAKNVGGWADFTKMNVIQQEKLAAAVGMTADELSNSLMDQENLKELAEEARSAGDEDLAKQIEARDAQQQFADAVEKVKGIFTDLVGGPVGQLLTVIAEIVSVVAGVLAPILNVVFLPIKLITPYLDTILKTTLLIVGAYKTLKFLGDAQYRQTILTNVAKKIGWVTDKESLVIQRSSNWALKQSHMTETQKEMVKKRSLATTVAQFMQNKLNTALLKIGLITKQQEGILNKGSLLTNIKKGAAMAWNNTLRLLGLKTSTETLAIEKSSWLGQIKKNALLVWGNIIKMKDFMMTKASNILEGIKLGYLATQNGLAARRNLLDQKGLVKAVGTAVFRVISSLAKIPYIGWALGIAAGAAVAGMAAKYMMAEGGVVKPKSGGTPVTIGEAGEPEMVVPLSKAPEMGFGGSQTQNQQEKVIVVQSSVKYDGYAATNVNNYDSATNSSGNYKSLTFA